MKCGGNRVIAAFLPLCTDWTSSCSSVQESTEVPDIFMLEEFFGCGSVGEMNTMDSVTEKQIVNGEDAKGNMSECILEVS